MIVYHYIFCYVLDLILISWSKHMNEEMVELGGLLREKRKELNLSLKEIENATSIRAGYIQAIEEGRVCEFIAPAYGVGFLRHYIRFLGLSTEDLMREFPVAFHVPNASNEFSYGLGSLEVRETASSKGKTGMKVFWSSLFFLLLGVAWYLAKLLKIL